MHLLIVALATDRLMFRMFARCAIGVFKLCTTECQSAQKESSEPGDSMKGAFR